MILVVGDRHGLPFGALGLEVLPLGEAHGAGEDDRGEALYLRVVRLDRVVVVLSREGDLVLRRGELLLEVDQYRAGTELRIVLGHRKQIPDGPTEPCLGLGLLSWRLGLHSLRAGLRYLRKHVLLLAEILLHAFEEVRDQVVPAL